MECEDDVAEDSPETVVAGADMFGPFRTLARGDSLEELPAEPALLAPDLALEGVGGGVITLAGVLSLDALAGGVSLWDLGLDDPDGRVTSLGGDLDLEADTTLTSPAGGHLSMSGEGDSGASTSWLEEGTDLLDILS